MRTAVSSENVYKSTMQKPPVRLPDHANAKIREKYGAGGLTNKAREL